MKLFVIYVGGTVPGANVELHDMRFAVGETITDCHDALRRQWWGTPGSLHLDAWGVLEQADGYDITLSTAPYGGAEKLWFLNLGGYDVAQFTELHRNVFVVAETEAAAKSRALKQVAGWKAQHRDRQMDVDNAINLHSIMAEQAWHIHLSPMREEKPFRFVCKYTKLS